MIDALACVTEIMDHLPRSEPLIDFLLWATKGSEIRKTAEYDRVVEAIYSKTESAAQHREDFLASREADDPPISSASH